MRLLIALILVFTHSCAFAAPFGIIKCATGTPTPTKYTMAVNGGSMSDVPVHVGADQAVYFLVDAAMLPQGAGVKLEVAAVNGFGTSPTTTIVTDIGAPAKPDSNIQWVNTKP